MTAPDQHTMWGRRPDFWAGVIVCVTTLIRLWFVATGQLDLVQDEAHYWDWSRTPQLSYYSKGPLISSIIAFWTSIFGNTELGVRMGAIVGALIGQVLLYLVLSRLWGRHRLGVWVLFMANTMPLFLASGVIMTTDNPLMVCWVGALFCLFLAGREGSSAWPFAGIALCLAVGTLAKYLMVGFIPVALIYGAWLSRRREAPAGFWTKLGAALAVGSVVGLLPIVLWNLEHGFAGVLHVLHRGELLGSKAGDLLDLDKFPEYLGSQVGVLTPWWFVFILIGAVSCLRQMFGRGHRPLGFTDQQAALLSVGFWPIWLFYLLLSLHTRVEANWAGVTYAAGIIMGGAAWQDFWESSRSWWAQWKKVWPVLGCLVFALIFLQNMLPVPAQYNPAHRLKGWADLGYEVGHLKEECFEDPSRVFVFSESYDMTSALSFYVPGQERAYCIDTGRRLNQYDFWPGPDANHMGWDGVLVLKDKGEPLPEEVAEVFSRVGERIDFVSMHRGSPAREFTLYCCYGYKGPWPRKTSGVY